jgi:hypothetical protein
MQQMNFYCRSYCLLNMFRVQLCPSSGARGYYTSGCIWCLVSRLLVWCVAEGYVSGLRAAAAARKPDTQNVREMFNCFTSRHCQFKNIQKGSVNQKHI